MLLLRRPNSHNLSIIIPVLSIFFQYTTAWVLPFISTDGPSSVEEQDRWLSTPVSVTHRQFHPKAAELDRNQREKGRVLILTPLKDASLHLRHHFALLANLTYPHHLIDLGFIIGDTIDDTRAVLDAELDVIENRRQGAVFNSCTIVTQDLGAPASQEVVARHGFAAQIDRRKKIAVVRNTLLRKTLTADHHWVYWRDVDVAESPVAILEDMIAHDKDLLVPNIWFRRQQKGKLLEGGYDYNSWQETPQSEAFKEGLDTEVIVFEGYAQFKTHRRHMAKLGDWRNDAALEIPLDGVGGVSLLVRADIHRRGIDFPIKPVDHQIETEGFAKMAKIAGYGVFGLPNYVVWHFDTAEKEGNLHETPPWLWPLVGVLGVVMVVVGWRFGREIGRMVRGLRGGGGREKVRRY